MADPQSEAKIRDLEQRMAAMPGSRIFVGLAEEYRRAGRFNDALATLRTGLEAHPGYLSARIAIARLFQEMGRDDEAIDAFSRVLAADRENLVAAKALGDLHSRHGNALEAVKKYKLYRALSGDRSVDAKVAVLEKEAKSEASPPLAPPPPPVPPRPAAPAEPRMFDPINFSDSSAEFRFNPNATLALSTLEFSPAPEEAGPPPAAESGAARTEAATEPTPVPAEDAREEPAIPPDLAASLSEITLPDLILPGEPGAAPPSAPEGAAEKAVSPPPAVAPEPELPPAVEAFSEPEPRNEAAGRETAPADEAEPLLAPPPELPPSRTLAELYERQGFRDEASRIYERLAAEYPGDESLTRRIAALREAPTEPSPEPPAEDPGARKRRVLESWLSRVKANAAVGAKS